jgi:hypothetical protein
MRRQEHIVRWELILNVRWVRLVRRRRLYISPWDLVNQEVNEFFVPLKCALNPTGAGLSPILRETVSACLELGNRVSLCGLLFMRYFDFLVFSSAFLS